VTGDESRSRIFIASSNESVSVAEYLQDLLDDHFETTVWTQGVVGVSRTILDSLIGAARDYDYAILVLGADDVVARRGSWAGAPRDNVIFELGLFIGALGKDKTFIVHSRDTPPSIPTDLLGVTAAAYRERQDGNLRAALGPVSLRIREAIRPRPA